MGIEKLINETVVESQSLDEMKLYGTSAIADALRNFFRTGEALKDELETFVRLKLVQGLKRLTLKGVALALGMDIDSDATPESFSIEAIKQWYQQNKAQSKKHRSGTYIFDRGKIYMVNGLGEKFLCEAQLSSEEDTPVELLLQEIAIKPWIYDIAIKLGLKPYMEIMNMEKEIDNGRLTSQDVQTMILKKAPRLLSGSKHIVVDEGARTVDARHLGFDPKAIGRVAILSSGRDDISEELKAERVTATIWILKTGTKVHYTIKGENGYVSSTESTPVRDVIELLKNGIDNVAQSEGTSTVSESNSTECQCSECGWSGQVSELEDSMCPKCGCECDVVAESVRFREPHELKGKTIKVTNATTLYPEKTTDAKVEVPAGTELKIDGMLKGSDSYVTTVYKGKNYSVLANKLSSGVLVEELQSEASQATLDRIAGVVNVKDVEQFKKTVKTIVDDLYDEGFRRGEIALFINSLSFGAGLRTAFEKRAQGLADAKAQAEIRKIALAIIADGAKEGFKDVEVRDYIRSLAQQIKMESVELNEGKNLTLRVTLKDVYVNDEDMEKGVDRSTRLLLRKTFDLSDKQIDSSVKDGELIFTAPMLQGQKPEQVVSKIKKMSMVNDVVVEALQLESERKPDREAVLKYATELGKEAFGDKMDMEKITSMVDNACKQAKSHEQALGMVKNMISPNESLNEEYRGEVEYVGSWKSISQDDIEELHDAAEALAKKYKLGMGTFDWSDSRIAFYFEKDHPDLAKLMKKCKLRREELNEQINLDLKSIEESDFSSMVRDAISEVFEEAKVEKTTLLTSLWVVTVKLNSEESKKVDMTPDSEFKKYGVRKTSQYGMIYEFEVRAPDKDVAKKALEMIFHTWGLKFENMLMSDFVELFSEAGMSDISGMRNFFVGLDIDKGLADNLADMYVKMKSKYSGNTLKTKLRDSLESTLPSYVFDKYKLDSIVRQVLDESASSQTHTFSTDLSRSERNKINSISESNYQKLGIRSISSSGDKFKFEVIAPDRSKAEDILAKFFASLDLNIECKLYTEAKSKDEDVEVEYRIARADLKQLLFNELRAKVDELSKKLGIESDFYAPLVPKEMYVFWFEKDNAEIRKLMKKYKLERKPQGTLKADPKDVMISVEDWDDTIDDEVSQAKREANWTPAQTEVLNVLRKATSRMMEVAQTTDKGHAIIRRSVLADILKKSLGGKATEKDILFVIDYIVEFMLVKESKDDLEEGSCGKRHKKDKKVTGEGSDKRCKFLGGPGGTMCQKKGFEKYGKDCPFLEDKDFTDCTGYGE